MIDAKRSGLLFRVVPAALYVGAVLYGGVARIRELPSLGALPADKVYHALAFALMLVLAFRALAFLEAARGVRAQLWHASLFSSALGALVEVIQAFLPYRSADVWDWVADTLGAGLAALLLLGALGSAPPRAGVESDTDA